ncbi:MAG: polyisoprenoid-binding protein [Archangiaceae bacterium]|nr:polyisoprenoid-binding protein [Archangiaceae bacterium]
MKTAAAFLSAVLAVPALASSWEIDPAHTSARFSVKHMMVSDVSGTLGRTTGTVELDEKDLTRSKVDLSIEVHPQTQEAKRDAHLESPDFFDVAKFPKATFKSKKVEKAGENKLKVTGELTLKDVTKEVTLDVTLIPEVTNPFTKQPARGAIATGTINRLDWNLKWNAPMANNALVVGNDVKIEFVAELAPKLPPAQAVKK